jgi:hypothetical protein
MLLDIEPASRREWSQHYITQLGALNYEPSHVLRILDQFPVGILGCFTTHQSTPSTTLYDVRSSRTLLSMTSSDLGEWAEYIHALGLPDLLDTGSSHIKRYRRAIINEAYQYHSNTILLFIAASLDQYIETDADIRSRRQKRAGDFDDEELTFLWHVKELRNHVCHSDGRRLILGKADFERMVEIIRKYKEQLFNPQDQTSGDARISVLEHMQTATGEGRRSDCHNRAIEEKKKQEEQKISCAAVAKGGRRRVRR